MLYEVTSKRIKVDDKGINREVAEKYIVDGCELFGEAELKTLRYWNNENDVTAIKQSRIREFVNDEDLATDKDIYTATIADLFRDDQTGEEKQLKYVVAVWAISVEDATYIITQYMKQGLMDMVLLGVKKTSFVGLIE